MSIRKTNCVILLSNKWALACALPQISRGVLIRSLLATNEFEVGMSMLLIHFTLFHFVSAKSFGDGNE